MREEDDWDGENREVRGGDVRSGTEDVRPEVEQQRDSGRRMTSEGEGALGRRETSPEMELEVEMEAMAARRSGGGSGGLRRRRRRRLEDGGVAMTVEKNRGRGKEWRVVAAAAAAAVGLLPRPSLSSHLRGRSLLSFFK